MWHVQQHLQLRLCGDISSILEDTYIGFDTKAKSPILSIGDNVPWVNIKQYGEKFEIYSYRGKQDPPEILDRGTYATAYETLTEGTSILLCHNGLGRNNHGNVLLLPPFIMR